jgi:methionyl-tRNA formyltransferase
MLDAPTYPRAFIDHGNFRIEFSHAEKHDDEIRAKVVIRELKVRED